MFEKSDTLKKDLFVQIELNMSISILRRLYLAMGLFHGNSFE